MNNSSSLIQKLNQTKHKTLLAQSMCRSAYIPKKTSLSHVKKLFVNYFKLNKDPLDQSLLNSMEITSTAKQHKEKPKVHSNNPLASSNDKQILINAFVVHNKSPNLRVRKSVAKPKNPGTNNSLLIRRVKLNITSTIKPKPQTRQGQQRFENSNYTSYSDIYQSLLKSLQQASIPQSRTPNTL